MSLFSMEIVLILKLPHVFSGAQENNKILTKQVG